VDTQDTGTSLEVREVDSDLSVETARTKQSRIKNVDTICGGNGNDTGVSVETIHLDQNLVDSLFALVVTPALTTTALTSDGINLINEDDAGGVLLCLAKDVTDTGSSHTDKHLYKLGTRDTDERNTGLSGNSLGEKSLSGSWRTVKDHTTGDLASVLGVRLGLLQKVNDFFEFQFSTVAPGDIVKGYTGIGDHLDLSLGLSKAHLATTRASAGHATLTTSAAAAEEEETGKESSREDETLGELAQTTGFLRRQDSHINLKNKSD
jgi:hypothetical protein